MKLRKLIAEDAPRMLEWMHNPDVTKYMRINFEEKTVQDCIEFIKDANESRDNLHLAVVNDENKYMGTVSLKNINQESAEFAIIMRKDAIGKGYAKFAMKSIIKIGFEKYGLKRIYWNVMQENKRAIRFYDKNGYKRVTCETVKAINADITCILKQVSSLYWYICTSIEDF